MGIGGYSYGLLWTTFWNEKTRYWKLSPLKFLPGLFHPVQTTSVPKDAIKFIMYDGWYIDWGTMRYYGISQEPTISVTLGNAAERQSIVLGKDHYFWEGEGWEDGQFPTEKKHLHRKRYLKKSCKGSHGKIIEQVLCITFDDFNSWTKAAQPHSFHYWSAFYYHKFTRENDVRSWSLEFHNFDFFMLKNSWKSYYPPKKLTHDLLKNAKKN